VTHAVTEVIEACIQKVTPIPHQKWWWSLTLMAKRTELGRLTCRAYSRRTEQDDPVHLEHREARRVYGMLIDKPRESIGMGSWNHSTKG